MCESGVSGVTLASCITSGTNRSAQRIAAVAAARSLAPVASENERFISSVDCEDMDWALLVCPCMAWHIVMICPSCSVSAGRCCATLALYSCRRQPPAARGAS